MADEKEDEETYSLIFSSLKHPIRRKILRMLENRELTFSEILEVLAIDSGHLSYHLENLGDLIVHTQDGKYRLSSFGTAAVKLMGGVEEYDARTTPSRSKAVTIAKIFSLALAVTLLLVSLYSMNLVTSAHINDVYGLSNTPLVIAQNESFNYFLNFTQESSAYVVYGITRWPNGLSIVDPQLSGSINEWEEYYPQLEFAVNQTQSQEFHHAFLNITLYDSKGNAVKTFDTQGGQRFQGFLWGVPGGAVGSSGGGIGATISRPDNYSMEVRNMGPDWLYANVSVYVMRDYLQKPVFYYGLTGLVMTSSYLVVFFAGLGWTKRRNALHHTECQQRLHPILEGRSTYARSTYS